MNTKRFYNVWGKMIPAVALLLAVPGVRAAEAWTTNYDVFGTLVVAQFATAPFPHPDRAEGHKYHDEFFSAAEHYSDGTVAMFIPKNFQAADKVDFVIHFHGWRHTVASTLKEYKLIEQFAASGRNAVLIVPEGPHNAADSFGGKLEDTNGFKMFMVEAMEKLGRGLQPASTPVGRATPMRPEGRAPEIGSIILSGHSGGYHVMAAIVDHGGLTENIKEVWLFDALYGGTDNFVAWQKQENGRLLDIYTDHGGTREETEKLMASLRTNGVNFFATEDTNAVPENLRTNKIVFLHTDMVHDDVIAKRGTFGQFLKSSCLQTK